jgi:plasmid stabilization system protein ParE
MVADNDDYDIAWDNTATTCLKEIFNWYKKNVSEEKAQEIRFEIVSGVQRLATSPEIFPIELSLLNLPYTIRYVRIRDFKVLDHFTGQTIIVAYIHHVKQNPKRLQKHFKNF